MTMEISVRDSISAILEIQEQLQADTIEFYNSGVSVSYSSEMQWFCDSFSSQLKLVRWKFFSQPMINESLIIKTVDHKIWVFLISR